MNCDVRLSMNLLARPSWAAGSASILLAVETGGRMPPEPARKMRALLALLPQFMAAILPLKRWDSPSEAGTPADEIRWRGEWVSTTSKNFL